LPDDSVVPDASVGRRFSLVMFLTPVSSEIEMIVGDPVTWIGFTVQRR
jgi:hypothetical protein